MLDYTQPLTQEESDFAAAHHNLIGRYLRRARLPEDDFYDVAVFGYLRAVRKYLARPELWQYQFCTIAFRAMSCDVRHSREYWTRAKRNAAVYPLNEDVDTETLRDPVQEHMDNVISFHAAAGRLTPLQRRIAAFRADGYSNQEIAKLCSISYGAVKQEMEDARVRILHTKEDCAALAA